MPRQATLRPDGPRGTLDAPPIKAPLGKATYHNEVNARVAVRLVQLDYQRNPARYKCKFLGILALASELRLNSHCPYTGFFVLQSLSKYVCSGGTMASWIVWYSTQTWEEMRAIHKRSFTVPRRR